MKFSDQVPALLELQNIDLSIDRIEARMKALPALLAQMEASSEQWAKACSEARDQAKIAEIQRKKIELEIEGFREQTTKLEGQMLTVKTNKEYQALQKEIADRKEHAFRKEDAVLEVMEDLEKLHEKIAEADQKAHEAATRLEKERIEVQGEVKQLEQSLAEKRQYRQSVAREIDKTILSRYVKIRIRGGGVGLAKLDEGTCGECHMDMRPQLQNEIKMGDKPVLCETCNRLLYTDWLK